LLKKLNIKKDIRVADTSQLFVYVDEEIVDLKGWKDWNTPHDGTPVKISRDFNPEEMDDGSYIWKIGGYVYRLPSKGFYFDAIKSPLEDAETTSDIEKYHIPVMEDEEKEWYRKGAKELREKTDI